MEPHTASNYPVYNKPELVDLLSEGAQDVLGAGKCKVSTSRSPACFGGESFGFFSNEKPALNYWLGGAKGRAHAGDYDIDHNVLPLVVAVHCGLVWEFLHRQ
ncbi:MAG: M20/M25/M40 family metallo-hydrolase [Pirellulales bacterium]|nr:M20/M25/M40 family metallo-hydrolase [Pirellulales bacterium]